MNPYSILHLLYTLPTTQNCSHKILITAIVNCSSLQSSDSICPLGSEASYKRSDGIQRSNRIQEETQCRRRCETASFYHTTGNGTWWVHVLWMHSEREPEPLIVNTRYQYSAYHWYMKYAMWMFPKPTYIKANSFICLMLRDSENNWQKCCPYTDMACNIGSMDGPYEAEKQYCMAGWVKDSEQRAATINNRFKLQQRKGVVCCCWWGAFCSFS